MKDIFSISDTRGYREPRDFYTHYARGIFFFFFCFWTLQESALFLLLILKVVACKSTSRCERSMKYGMQLIYSEG